MSANFDTSKPLARKDAWILTASGIAFKPFDVTPEMICVEDIANALSKIPRFGGHTSKFHSVAAHSVDVSWVCDEDDAGYGLLHDAAEAYLGDIPTPIKCLFPGIEEAENTILGVIYAKFGLDPNRLKPESVRRADAQQLMEERTDLLPDHPGWPALTSSGGYCAYTALPDAANRRFLRRFNQLVASGHIKNGDAP